MFENFSAERRTVNGVDIFFRKGGKGPPLLLLHGYPQNHVMWHKLAPALAERFTVICPDLRGYGQSQKPPGGPNHIAYAKRTMAQDQVELMAGLGFSCFAVVGHDRGARVTHRLCLDHPKAVARAAVIDIAPTREMYARTDQAFATAYFHWFFLIQQAPLPETLLAGAPDLWLEACLGKWGGDSAFAPEALASYKAAFRDPAMIHASCEDYRAAATIDLEHDAADLEKKVDCPLLVLWGTKGVVGRSYDVLSLWAERARQLEGKAIQGGHFLPEEAPQEMLAALWPFLTPWAETKEV